MRTAEVAIKSIWVLGVLLSISSAAQAPPAKDTKRNSSSQARSVDSSRPQSNGQQLLELAEQEAHRLEGPMRPWALWQAARIYQSTDKKKALQLLDTALAEASVIKDIPPSKTEESAARRTGGTPPQSTKAWLQQEIARTMVVVDPGRADELLQTLDPANRGPVLLTLMSYYERKKLTDRALEQFYRITSIDEAPYSAAGPIMAGLKPEQSSELAAIFGACLRSYQAHAPHNFFPAADDFPRLFTAYWRRVPRQLARDAIDEVLKQAEQSTQDSNANAAPSMSFDVGGRSLSLMEYRIVEFMPVLRELEESKVRDYLERFPYLADVAGSYTAPPPPAAVPAGADASPRSIFRPYGDFNTIMFNMSETPLATKVADKADAGHADEAMADVANIRGPDLRVQAFEYIARVTMKKDPGTAASALAKMVAAVEKVHLERQPAYYSAAAGIFIAMGDLPSARNAIEKGLTPAAQLYKQDTDSDDPNTALEAFWPSTNAYCTLLRQARRISEPWAISLLKEIDDPTVKVAAEVAIASSALDVPASRERIRIWKRKRTGGFDGPDVPVDGRD
jgi:hypothetical protein